MRNQSIVGSKLPDLSETAEQEKGDSPHLYFEQCHQGCTLPESQGKSVPGRK